MRSRLRTGEPRTGLWTHLRRSVRFARPHAGKLFVSVGLISIGSAMTLLLPLGVRALLNTAVEDRDVRSLHLLALGLLLLFVVRAVLSFLGNYLLQATGEHITVELRRELFAHLHKLDFLYIANRRIGDLANRVASDSTYIRTLVSDSAVSVVVQAVQLMGSVAIMISLDWQLGAIALALAPATTIVSHVFGPRLRDVSRELQEHVGRSTTLIFESLSAIHVVKTFGRAAHEAKRYGSILDDVTAAYTRSVKVQNVFRGTTGLLTTICSIAIFWYGGLRVVAGELTAGDVVAFLFYSQVITGAVAQLTQVYGTFSSAAGSADRVFQILDTAPQVIEASPALAPPEAYGAIRFERVSFAYEGRVATLEDVSFDVAAGTRLALVGPSGGGKTTVVNLLLRLFDPSSGRILIDGHDLRELELRWLWERIAVVGQDVFLFGMSIRDNIRYGRLDATDDEVEAAARAAQAHEFIVRLPHGYDMQVGERGVKLSGGQKQRIAIARAFLKNAPILVFDEATSHVDTASERLIQEAFDRLCAGRTAIVVAHRLSTVRAADQILVLQDGRIVEAGRHEVLLKQRNLYHFLVEGHASPAADDRLQTSHHPPVALR
jgi:subfamily B ATP-binding cassette protein MsbA